MVATPDPERVPRDGVRCEFACSSCTEGPEPLTLGSDSGLGANGDRVGGASASSRKADD
jgi:hypothetical protein